MSILWGPVIRNPDEFSTLCELPGSLSFRHQEKLMHVSVDIKETPEGYEFFVDLPGMKKEDVTVKLEGKSVLSISGGRTRLAMEGPEGAWHREERVMGSFVRKFRLPDKADPEGISASVADGVLIIRLPKHTPGAHETHVHETHIPIN